jgi:hypothetical protein
MGVPLRGGNSAKKGRKKPEESLQIAAMHGYIARTFSSPLKDLRGRA